MPRQTRPSPKSTTTLQEVAAHAGVSLTTAAAILRDAPGLRASRETRQRVQEASVHLGYRRNALAASLRSGRTHTVGVFPTLLYPGVGRTLSDMYGLHVFGALFTAAGKRGLRLIAAGSSVEEILDGRLDGVVLVGVHDKEFVARIYEAGLPCVEMSSGVGSRIIGSNNETGVAAAIAYLVSLGHRHIAHWCGGGTNRYGSDRRQAAFETCAALQGLPPSQTPVVETADEVRNLLQRSASDRPTALFAFNDLQAFQTLDIARELGLRVPEDLSVIGFDDTMLADLARPMLTTVHNPLDEQAEAVLTVLQELWNGVTDPPIPPALPTHLVVRDSTAPPALAFGQKGSEQ